MMLIDTISEATNGYDRWLGVTGPSNVQAIANAIDIGFKEFHFDKKFNKNDLVVYFYISSYMLHKYRRNLFETDNQLPIKYIVIGMPYNLSDDKIKKAVEKETNILRRLLIAHNIELGHDEKGEIVLSSMADMEIISFDGTTRKLNPLFKELILDSMAKKNLGNYVINLIEGYAEQNIDPIFIKDFIDELVNDEKLTKRKIKKLEEKLHGQNS